MQKIRGYEVVSEEYIKIKEVPTKLPVCTDQLSAGDDFYAKETVYLAPGKQHLFWTDIKAYMGENEVLTLAVRSSIGNKRNLMLANTVGIIDASYYNNKENDGNIGICLYNYGTRPERIDKGERIAQGVFLPFLMPDQREALQTTRESGFGHSGK